MAYTLGSITLPNPKTFRRELIEVGTTVLCLDGTTKKDLTNRKERFVLSFQSLTQAQMASILSEYNDATTKNFSVSETNLTISETPVHIELDTRNYLSGGNEYREDIVLILTEVS